ncbi:MAG: hypothetical protein G01um101470_397, partial [Parcubacteria group bacterium Gr01-1014_70]
MSEPINDQPMEETIEETDVTELTTYNPKNLEEGYRAWEKLGVESSEGLLSGVFYYHSIATTEQSLRGQVLMLYAIAKKTGRFKTMEEKVEILEKSIESVPPMVAIDIVRLMDFQQQKMEQMKDPKPPLQKMFLERLEERYSVLPKELLVSTANIMATHSAEKMKEVVDELNQR